MDMHYLGPELKELSYEGNREIHRRFAGTGQTNCMKDDKDMDYDNEPVTHSNTESIETPEDGLAIGLYSYPYPPPSANDADNAESIDEQAISHDNSHQAATARANFSLSADIVPQDKPSEHDEDKHSQHNEERLIEEGQHHPDGNAYMGKMKRRPDSSGKEGIGNRMRQESTSEPQLQDSCGAQTRPRN
jgi:hypothetical protein